MPNTKTRIVGSGFSALVFNGQPIAFLDGWTDSGQRPVAEYEPVTPLGNSFPVEIATARALREGTLTITIRELWSGPVWQQLAGLENTVNLIDVYNRIASLPGGVSAVMTIKVPGSTTWRTKTYFNCVVTDIDDREQVSLGALTIPKNLVLVYTNAKYDNVPAGALPSAT
jgi:hypothetical protein